MGQLVDSRIGLGERILFEGHAWTVAGLPGGLVELVDVLGRQLVRSVFQLIASPGFEILDRGPLTPPPAAVAGLGSQEEAERQALWWEQHIVEVIPGQRPGEGAFGPRPAFDPRVHDLAAREAAKGRELAAAGVSGASARTVRRKRQRYQVQGRAGLVDARTRRAPAAGSRLDPRVVECLLNLLSILEGQPPRPMDNYQSRTREMFISRYGEDELGVMPSRTTFYRLLKQLSPLHGRAREQLVQRGRRTAIAGGTWLSRPGQRVFLHSLQVRIGCSDNWMEVTVALDELTRSVCSVAVDALGVVTDSGSLLTHPFTR